MPTTFYRLRFLGIALDCLLILTGDISKVNFPILFQNTSIGSVNFPILAKGSSLPPLGPLFPSGIRAMDAGLLTLLGFVHILAVDSSLL